MKKVAACSLTPLHAAASSAFLREAALYTPERVLVDQLEQRLRCQQLRIVRSAVIQYNLRKEASVVNARACIGTVDAADQSLPPKAALAHCNITRQCGMYSVEELRPPSMRSASARCSTVCSKIEKDVIVVHPS